MTGSTPEGAARAAGRRVLEAEGRAVLALAGRLGEEFDAAVEALVGCTGRVVLLGMGKSGLVARKIAATLSSTGTPALFVHPAEAAHGDLGGVVPGDVVICASATGETDEIVRLLPFLDQIASRLVALCGRRDSTLGRAARVFLDVSVDAEACPLGLAPTASTTALLAMGDALAMAVAERKGFSAEEFGRNHPAGALGRRFLRVADIMHAGPALPCVAPDASVRAVIHEMSDKRLGMTTVLEDGRLLGIITDGDIRRLLGREAQPLDLCARDIMTAEPRTCGPDLLAARALELMGAPPHAISSLIVTDADARALGVLHVHDLWRARTP